MCGLALVGCFVLVSLITIGVGVDGSYFLREFGDDATTMGALNLPLVENVLTVKECSNDLKAVQRPLIFADLPPST